MNLHAKSTVDTYSKMLRLLLVIGVCSAQVSYKNANIFGLYEDATELSRASIFGEIPPYNRSISVQAQNKAFVLDRDIVIDLENIPVEEQTIDYIVGNEANCSDILLVQATTELFQDVLSVLPWRSILVVDCINGEAGLTPVTRFQRKSLFNGVTGATMHAVLIPGEELAPGSIVNIYGKDIFVEHEETTRNYIINLDQWLNIQNKGQFVAERGVFSMFSPDYRSTFQTHAQQLPFSQSVLLQLVPLGSTLDADIEASASDLSYASAFVDFIYCGGHNTPERRCNGTVFVGNYPGGHTFNGEQHEDIVAHSVNKLMGDIYYDQYEKSFQKEATVRVRLLNSIYAEYEDKIGQSGQFANNPVAAWVSTKPSDLKPGSNRDNQLPHEFGHSYGLPDLTGKNLFEYKHRDFQMREDNTLSVPFFDTFKYKRGPMNGGYGDYTDDLFTSYTAFDKALIAKRMRESEDIDSRILIRPDANDETVLIILLRSDVLAYRINALIPSVIGESNQPFIYSEDYVEIQSFNQAGQIQGTIKYNVHLSVNSIVALPQGFLPRSGHLQVRRPHRQLSRRFFVRNDAITLAPPLLGNRKDVFKSLSQITLVTTSQLALTQNNEAFTNILSEYDSTIVISSKTAPLRNIRVPVLSSTAIGNSLTIYNNADIQMIVSSMGLPPVTLAAGEVIFMVFRDGWRETQFSASPTRVVRPISPQEEGAAFVQDLYKPNYRNIQIKTEDGVWQTKFTLYTLEESFLGNTVEFICSSGYPIYVFFHEMPKAVVHKGDTLRLEYTSGWDYSVEQFNKIPTLNYDGIYQLSCLEAQTVSAQELEQLFLIYTTIVVEASSSCSVDRIELPDMDLAVLGRRLIFKDIAAKAQVQAGPQVFTLMPPVEYTFSFSNPWILFELTENGNSPSVLRENTLGQRQLIVKNETQLALFADYTYVFEMLEQYDVIDLHISDGCFTKYLHFEPSTGYYAHAFKIVRVFVDSTWAISLEMGTSTHLLTTGARATLQLDVGWKLSQIK